MKLFGKQISKQVQRDLISRFIMIVLSFAIIVAFAVTSVAWFAINRQVGVTGMSVRVEVSANLVVSDSATTIAGYSQSGWNASYSEKVWNDSPTELIPTDHYDSTTYPAVDGTNTFNLVYNSNPENVGRATGRGADLTFAHVPSDGEDKYFIDRVIYIASLNKAMTRGQDYSVLTFSINEVGNGTTTNSAYKAASVDIYVSGTFKGTVNLDTLDSISVSDVGTIPLNLSGSIPITFRCYFNGALQHSEDASKTYVNSRDLAVSTDDISIDISVRAE
ncbi:MAG: hypothetical protein ILP02_01440 [Clostridia bacterium]|nr:hypothetical protein [Clostridia bacterium]